MFPDFFAFVTTIEKFVTSYKDVSILPWLVSTTGEFGSLIHSPSTLNLYSWLPSASSTMATKSLAERFIRSFCQSLNVPVEKIGKQMRWKTGSVESDKKNVERLSGFSFSACYYTLSRHSFALSNRRSLQILYELLQFDLTLKWVYVKMTTTKITSSD